MVEHDGSISCRQFRQYGLLILGCRQCDGRHTQAAAFPRGAAAGTDLHVVRSEKIHQIGKIDAQPGKWPLLGERGELLEARIAARRDDFDRPLEPRMLPASAQRN